LQPVTIRGRSAGKSSSGKWRLIGILRKWPVLVLHSDTYDKTLARTKRPLVLPGRHVFVHSASILQPISLFQTQYQ